MDHERERVTFDVAELTNVVYGGPEALAQRRRIFATVENDPVFRKTDRPFQSRPSAYKRGLEKSLRLARILETPMSDEEMHMTRMAIDEDIPTGLHYVMFIPALNAQGTTEQKEKWLTMAKQHRIIGTYAQTELGHGSYVGGIETTATYDPATETFDVHSPTLSATKWWPGSLGRTATHAVVMARLLSRGTDHGPHLFMVQLRCLENHEMLPGITVGDIGPKAGYETIDNGFLRLNHVKIPRGNMLMGLARIEPDGTYVPAKNQKLNYGTMVFVRAGIVGMSSSVLARATTVAVRYSLVRRQFPDPANKGTEKQVIDYITQQEKLFPFVAASYAFHFLGRYMRTLYNNSTRSLSQGDMSSLMELHSTSSGLKAITTATTVEGIEICRRACGGHGYSKASGLIDLYASFLPSCTYEGENTVMAQSSASFLMKCIRLWNDNKRDQVPTTLGYLFKPMDPAEPAFPFPASVEDSEAFIVNCFERASRFHTRRLYEKMSHPAHRKLDFGIELCISSNLHSQVIIINVFRESLNALASNSGISSELLTVLRQLFLLYGWHEINKNLSAFLLSGCVDLHPNKHTTAVSQQSQQQSQCPMHSHIGSCDVSELCSMHIRTLYAQLRPNAIGLVDAWDFSDAYLNSCLGRYDGNYCEALWTWANQHTEETDQFEGYRDILDQILQRPSSSNSSSSSSSSTSFSQPSRKGPAGKHFRAGNASDNGSCSTSCRARL